MEESLLEIVDLPEREIRSGRQPQDFATSRQVKQSRAESPGMSLNRSGPLCSFRTGSLLWHTPVLFMASYLIDHKQTYYLVIFSGEQTAQGASNNSTSSNSGQANGEWHERQCDNRSTDYLRPYVTIFI